MERIFDDDVISKRERVELTLEHREVDRVALHEQLGYNPGVIAKYNGREVRGFDYSLSEIGQAIRATLDMCFPFFEPVGTGVSIDEDGFAFKHDNWTTWRISRPFDNEGGAADWLRKVILRKTKNHQSFDPDRVREEYVAYIDGLQRLAGDTVICDYSATGFCSVFDRMGLEIFSYFCIDFPQLLTEYLELSTRIELKRIPLVADRERSPVILIPEDFSTKQGPIFSPAFLREYHYPYVKRITAEWMDFTALSQAVVWIL